MKTVFRNALRLFLLYLIQLTALDISAQNSLNTSNTLIISEGWYIQSSSHLPANAGALSTSLTDPAGWYKASVPSTVMGVLSDNGHYKELLADTNYKKADTTPFNKSWWYKTTFKLPSFKNRKHAELIFEGLSYRANIWLNGKLIGSKEKIYGPFRQFSFNVSDLLKETNVLAVELFRAGKGEPNIGFVDWNPRPLDESMGIFRPVKLHFTDAVKLAGTFVQTAFPDGFSSADLSITTTVKNNSDRPLSGNLRAQIGSIIVNFPVRLSANEERKVVLNRKTSEALRINNPRLWWCNGMGEPHMYRLNLEFLQNNQVSDHATIDFGIRKIESYFTGKGHRGFMLNGRKVLVMSAGWTDDIFLRERAYDNELQMKYVKDMGLNSVRFENFWGSTQNIYDLCDKYGMLAFAGWSCQWEWENYIGTPDDEYGSIKSEHDMELLAESWRDQITWLRNHPSIIAWMAGSDKLPRPALEKRYLSILKEIDPDRVYLGAAKGLESVLSGNTGVKMLGPYEYVGPGYWFEDSQYGGAYGFNTETGPGAQLPILESIKKFIPENRLWPLNKSWDYHCTTSATALNSMEVITAAVNGNFGSSKDLADYLKKAHWLSYESTRAMFEAFRVNRPEATGVVQWMLNSAWPSLYWQLYDFYQIPVPAYYGVKNANKEVQLVYNYKDKQVYIINDSRLPAKGNAVIEIFDEKSQRVSRKLIKLNEPTGTIRPLDSISFSGKNVFLSLRITDGHQKLMSDNVYVLSAKRDTYNWAKSDWVGTPLLEYRNQRMLNNLPKASLKVSVKRKNTKGAIKLELTLSNTSNTIAFFNQVLLKDSSGEVIKPVFWEQNYFSILPGETRTLTGTAEIVNELGRNCVLELSGWNTGLQTIGI